MINQKLEEIFNTAIKKANILKHEFLSLEVIMSSLLDDPSIQEIITHCGGDPKQLRDELEEFLDQKDNFSILSDEEIEKIQNVQFQNKELKERAALEGIKYQPEISLSLQRVIQRAALHVQSSGKKDITSINVLVALFSEKESFATYLLEKMGIYRLNVVEYISHHMDRPKTSEEGPSAETNDPLSPKPKLSPLEEFTDCLNDLYHRGKLDPVVGRETEVARITQVLCRRKKNNPLLVGEAGVGKTAIANGLASAIEEGKVPDKIKGTKIYQLDMAGLLAGTKFRGDFEERLKGIVNQLIKQGEKGQKPILFIDEIHTIIGAGATSGGTMDASNLLKPALSNGDIRLMGSTTFSEYRKFFEKDQALSRRFQKIDILEPSQETTLKILDGLKSRFEEHHEVKYSPKALKAAVDLAGRYLPDRFFPDKAIDVIDEVGSLIQLRPNRKPGSNVQVKDIEEVISQMARVPQKTVQSDEKVKLKDLEKNLKLLIFGQDQAVTKVAQTILMSRSGLQDQDRPMASFLFAGPTGVGKTELAKQLAYQLGINFVRFDMSEYMEKHAVSKLIGAPPGYVGFDQGGLLTEEINKNPHAVLLLDEIEKAHPDIYNILLQVMDHGVLTDSNGRRVDFRNTVIIMTTNAGAREMDSGSMGLSQNMATNIDSSKRDKRIKEYFSPEFRNRLTAIIHFNKLALDQIVFIVDKFLAELEASLAERKVECSVSYDAKVWLARNGFDEKMGARPLQRLIETKIKENLAQELLFGRLEKGGKVTIGLKNDDLVFEIEKKS
jgi:ATP-dependent Clp protease ATP-binding subunit ClpA